MPIKNLEYHWTKYVELNGDLVEKYTYFLNDTFDTHHLKIYTTKNTEYVRRGICIHLVVVDAKIRMLLQTGV